MVSQKKKTKPNHIDSIFVESATAQTLNPLKPAMAQRKTKHTHTYTYIFQIHLLEAHFPTISIVYSMMLSNAAISLGWYNNRRAAEKLDET